MSRVEIKTVAALDRGLAYGESCFETVRVVDGVLFAWPAHWQRLQTGLAAFGIALDEADAAELHVALLEAADAAGRDVLLRLTISGGEAPWGLLPAKGRQPVARIQAMPVAARPAPARLQSLCWPFPLRARPAKFVGDYSDTLRAMQGWQAQLQEGCEPLIVTAGDTPHLLSGVTANLLLYRGNQWYTPAGDGILNGVVRGWLIEHAGVQTVACPQVWLEEVEAMALCNSGHFIRPVAWVDGHELDATHPALEELSATLAGQPGVPATVGEYR